MYVPALVVLAHTLLILYCTHFHTIHANCILSNTSLPDTVYAIQSAYIPPSNTVYIFRGYDSNLIYKWDISNSPGFVSIGTAPVSSGEFYSYANSVAVIDNLIYFVGNDREANHETVPVYIFDTDTESWPDNSNIQKPPNGGVDGCLTHNETHLFFIGGDMNDIGDTLQIYDIANNEWSILPIDLDDIIVTNYWGSFCWMTDNILYVFGGVTDSEYRSAMYKWEHNIGWSNIGSIPNSTPICCGKARKHPMDNNIWLIGGMDDMYIVYDKIYEFNIVSETAVLSQYRMTNPKEDMGVEIIDNDIYIFGGWQSSAIEVCRDIVNIAETTTTLQPSTSISNAIEPTSADSSHSITVSQPITTTTTTTTTTTSTITGVTDSKQTTTDTLLQTYNDYSTATTSNPITFITVSSTITATTTTELSSQTYWDYSTANPIIGPIYKPRYTEDIKDPDNNRDDDNQSGTNGDHHPIVSISAVAIAVVIIITLLILIVCGVIYKANVDLKKEIAIPIQNIEVKSGEDSVEMKRNEKDEIIEGSLILEVNDEKQKGRTTATNDDNDIENVCVTKDAMVNDRIFLGLISTDNGNLHGSKEDKEVENDNGNIEGELAETVEGNIQDIEGLENNNTNIITSL